MTHENIMRREIGRGVRVGAAGISQLRVDTFSGIF